MAEAGGVVTYQGAPVEGATVTFLPDDGLPAVANTDAQGRFTFMTRGESGAVVGPGKVSIAAVDQDRELSDEEFENISSEELSALRISRIPEKYNSPVSSGLTITVSEDPQQNQFPLDLK